MTHERPRGFLNKMELGNAEVMSVFATSKRHRFKNFILQMCRLVLIPVALPIYLALRAVGVHIINSTYFSAFGHQVTEPFIALATLEQRGKNSARIVIFASLSKLSNPKIPELLPRQFVWIRNGFLRALAWPIHSNSLFTLNMTQQIGRMDGAAPGFLFAEQCRPEKPFLKIPSKNDSEVSSLLEQLGIPLGTDYVCIHARQSQNAKERQLHGFRDADELTYSDSIDYLISLGFFVVRVASQPIMKLPNREGLINYPASPHCTPRNDALLYANCHFFFGNSSGAFTISAVQGIPILGVNIAPLGASRIWSSKDLALPKTYRHLDSGLSVSFKECMDRGVANFRDSESFIRNGILWHDNDAGEILDATIEMIETLTNKLPQCETDSRLQSTFNDLFNHSNYTYYSKTPISRRFLRKYAHLL